MQEEIKLPKELDEMLELIREIMPDEDGLRNHLGNSKLETDDTIDFALQGTYKIQNTIGTAKGKIFSFKFYYPLFYYDG